MFRCEEVSLALDAYRNSATEHYDDVLDAVSERARRTGAIGKLEIGALITWKRLRANSPWVADLMNTPEAVVLEATRAAREAALTGSGVADAGTAACRALYEIPGCRSGGAVASAIICALAPDRMAVYDRRARSALIALGFEAAKKRTVSYGIYLEMVEALRDECREWGRELTAREVDLALYKLGG
ncbi:MAG: hypothetical protein ACTINN_05205 [Brachybacterium tyrofermentans]